MVRFSSLAIVEVESYTLDDCDDLVCINTAKSQYIQLITNFNVQPNLCSTTTIGTEK
jgi:hypothetical protein